MPDLKGKVAIITGASSGIGAVTAEHLAKCGAFVAVGGRNVTNLQETRQKCLAAGLSEDQVLLVSGDVSKEEDAQKIVNDTLKHFGKIDILVNNAGIWIPGAGLEQRLEDFDKMMNVNVRSVIRLCQICAPHLAKTKGAIVNVSSVAAYLALPEATFYCLTKAALDQWTRCLALELAPKGVRVNSVNPGVVVTDLFNRSGMTPEQIEDFLNRAKITHPLGRAGEPKDVAQAVAFLAGDESSFISGHHLRVDGAHSILTPR
jgi:NAD(P)-dependent dehydrogenase (short-subunit alcohol dehydrogenase family)